MYRCGFLVHVRATTAVQDDGLDPPAERETSHKGGALDIENLRLTIYLTFKSM